jgi:hypothetical protein
MTDADLEYDTQRFNAIDAVRVYPISRRISDKRTERGRKRYVRPAGYGSVLLAECGCSHRVSVAGGTCPSCGGAELTIDEANRA